ncbi:MAG: hypothetical protein ACFB2W_28495 [Leptolyngbyaceae cyanobacterium]
MASSPDNTPASVPSRSGSGSGIDIAPQLESVLRNLNVNLEDELTRYRRKRHGRVPPPPPPRRAAQRKTLDLISVPATDAALDAQPPAPPNPFLQEGTETELSSDPSAQLAPEETASDTAPPEGQESVLPVPASDTPEGYLESSEELLKSIAEEQSESAPEPYSPDRKNNTLLKLAGLVLVLLGGTGVGFAITYPAQLQSLRSQIWPADTESEPETTEVETTENSGEPTASPESTDGYKPPGPDLSTQEFKELDDVEDLVTLDVDGVGSAPAPPLSNPAQTPIPAAPATPATPGQPAAPVPAGATGTTAIPTAPATPAPTTPAATGSNFYVVSSYTGDESLTTARELVPDAFVRNFKAGARIQLAAFDNRAQAEDQVAALTQQGAVVELFGPTNE